MRRATLPALLDHLVLPAKLRLEGRDHVADDEFRRVVQERRKFPFRRPTRLKQRAKLLNDERMLRHVEWQIAFRLAVPARDPGEAMGDVFDFDVDRGGIKEIEPPS